jgi:HAMP domain-containing protein
VTAQVDLQTPDLSHINRQIAQLQDQAASTQANVDNISSYMQRLPTTARVETNETKLSHVKTDLMQAQVSLDNLRAETRTLITQLQDAVGQMERRWQDLPHGASADRFRAELGEVVKAIARLVPQAEFSQLVDHVKDITRQQSRLEQALTKIPVGTVSGMPATVPPPSTTELERLATEVQTLQQQVNRQATAGHTQEHVQQVVSQYLGQVRAQVSQLEGGTRAP